MATANCRTWPAPWACARCAMAMRATITSSPSAPDGEENFRFKAKDESQSLFHLRSGQVHRLLALRARLRGGAGHLRADHRRPRLRLACLRRHGRGLPQFRMRVLRRLRAGLPDRDAHREIGHRARPAGALGGHHLRLLRRRLLLQGRDEGRRGGPHGALQGWRRQRGPFLRQGPLRLGLCHPQGPRDSSR